MKEEEQKTILLKVKEAMEYTGLGRNRLLDMAKIKRISSNNLSRRNNVYKRRIAYMVFKK